MEESGSGGESVRLSGAAVCDAAQEGKLPRGGEWLVAYIAYLRYGPSVAIATTDDFETVTRFGIVLPPSNKDSTAGEGGQVGAGLHLFDSLGVGQHHAPAGREENQVGPAAPVEPPDPLAFPASGIMPTRLPALLPPPG